MTTQLQTEQGIVRVPTGTWTVDPIHSSVGFEVKHMMISTVRGHFKQYEGTLEAAEDYHDSRVWGSGGLLVGDQVALRIDISAVRT